MTPTGSPQFPRLPIPPNPEQHMGLAIATFVERVQEHLAIFSIPDEAVGDYLQPTATTQYEPKSLVFEFLVNDHTTERAVPARRFELHVSERLMQTAYRQPQKVLDDLHRLYDNAARAGVDWQQVQWDTPLAIAKGLSGLAVDMQRLDAIYQRSQSGVNLSEPDLKETATTLQKLVKRWEIECIPTNFSANALIYEAWKLGNLLPLSRFDYTNATHKKLLDGLFIARTKERTATLLEQMPADLGLNVRRIDQDFLSNSMLWTRKLYPDTYPENGRMWFSCVEFSLIHRALMHQKEPVDRYLIHYPLIIDDYWFAGFAYVYAEWDDATLVQTPELFDRRKYLKFNKVIQAIADALKISRKRDALLRAATLVTQGKRGAMQNCEVN
jgi:hypothetical protein